MTLKNSTPGLTNDLEADHFGLLKIHFRRQRKIGNRTCAGKGPCDEKTEAQMCEQSAFASCDCCLKKFVPRPCQIAKA